MLGLRRCIYAARYARHDRAVATNISLEFRRVVERTLLDTCWNESCGKESRIAAALDI